MRSLGLVSRATMRQESRNEKKETWCCHQEEERTPGQMSGAKQIPDVEGYEASQGEDSSQFLSKPGHDQTNTDPDGPKGQADPLLRRRSWAVASHGPADCKGEDGKYAENAPR